MWCKNVYLKPEYQERINRAVIENIHKGRAIALAVNKIRRENYLKKVQERVKYLKDVFENKDVLKISLAILYLGEGAKTRKGFLTFGNSDPRIISLFMYLLRTCYKIDESKFRCTLQCRADQDIKKLEKFWSGVTKISLKQFYMARIDKRTIGQISKKLDYKGVCRIDYFSADLFNEIMKIIDLVLMGL